MIRGWTKLSAILRYLSLLSVWGFRFMPGGVNQVNPKHKSSRVSQAKGAGLFRTVGGETRDSGRKAAVLDTVSLIGVTLAGIAIYLSLALLQVLR